MVFCCRLNGCLCGCSLKTGTVILGVLNLVTALIIIIGFSIALDILYGIPPSEISLEGENAEIIEITEKAKDFVINCCITTLTFHVIQFLLNAMLLCGVGQKTAGLFLPWIIFEFLVMLFQLVMGILLVILLVNYIEKLNMAFSIGVTTFAVTVSRWYFLSVVHSHYKNVKNDNTYKIFN